MAWFTSQELFDSLLDCLKRDINVELILLDHAINFMHYAPDFNRFVNAGGKLRIAGSNVGFMHHKFCIVDNKIAITGSYNWTYYAESRNVENIVITDNADVVQQFSSEFGRLSRALPISTSSPRLSWEDIEKSDNVDFRELNYEIERICEIQQQPVRRVYETKTEVVKSEIHLTPYAKYSIGIQVFDDKRNVIFSPIIKDGVKLPYKSEERVFYFDSVENKEIPCLFLFGNPSDKNDWHFIRKEDLMQVAKGSSTDDPVLIGMALEDNGSLRVDVTCKTTGQRLTISALDSNWVKYE